jgi:hypothetical protein
MGAYRVETAPPLDITGCSVAQTGIARFAAGRRSPTSGFKQGCIHEVDYVISGRLRVDTPSDTYEIRAGDVVVANPDEPHATTAIEDSEIFFVLLDPFRS